MTLSGRYWPYHPKPLKDELFSSWLLRIAIGNAPATKVTAFYRANWPNRQIGYRDIDRSVDEALIESVALKSGTNLALARQTTLRSYEGFVFEALNIGGHSRWIRPLGLYHSSRNLWGLWWCPDCLKSDETPYFRKQWRMSFTSSCPKHGKILSDRCDNCESPCIPSKGGLTHCHTCGFDLRDNVAKIGESRALYSDYEMIKLSHDGVYSLRESGFLHSILYFDIWYQVISFLVYGPRSQALRDLISKKYGGDPSPYIQQVYQNRSFDSLSPTNIHRAKGMAARLMTGFPYGLIGLCAETDNWSSIVLKNMRPLRSGLSKPVKTHLFKAGTSK